MLNSYDIHSDTYYIFEPLIPISTYILSDTETSDEIVKAKVIKTSNDNFYKLAAESDEVFEETLYACCDNKPFIDFLEDKCFTLWYISHMSVTDEYRNQGYGSAMLSFLTQEILTQSEPMILLQSGTGIDGVNADEFYSKNGFIQVAETSFGNTIFCEVFSSLSLENNIQGAYLFRKEKHE